MELGHPVGHGAEVDLVHPHTEPLPIDTSELVFAAGMTTNRFTAAGAGFTKRVITSPDGDIAEDRRTSAIGSYNATAPLNAAAAWLIQIATFRAAGQ